MLNKVLKFIENRNIGLMKLDCEGSEYKILSSINDEMYDKIKFITMEVHNLDKHHNIATIQKILDSKGFKCIVKPEMFKRKRDHHFGINSIYG